MSTLKCFLFLVGLLCTVSACDWTKLHGYDEVAFPETVENLSDVNSPDDDYNSSLQVVGNIAALTFSSKRGGRTDFDFVREAINYSFDLRRGTFSFDTKPYWGLDAFTELTPLNGAVTKANSSANELGPYVLSYKNELIKDGTNRHYGEYLMLFASDRTGNLDVYLTHNYRDSTKYDRDLTTKLFADPVPVPALNSPADDGYPTFDREYKAIYFTSNRSGSFDLFKLSLPSLTPAQLHNRLPALVETAVERVGELSSSADDKCPFILGNRLVFTSNRPGGFGGYDLYYSLWDGNRWLAPVNFGPAINTASDEYRPILTGTPEFTNQLMIFSSDRPGGKGGFDLYRVGVPKVN